MIFGVFVILLCAYCIADAAVMPEEFEIMEDNDD